MSAMFCACSVLIRSMSSFVFMGPLCGKAARCATSK
jgi:hypothetical protein